MFQVKKSAVCCAVMLLVAGAHAQDAAIATKKSSESIVEAISTADIGKMADYSIAEQLARLPGLSAQRVAGRAQVINVRGLSPDFSTSLLNGRELASTGNNRSTEFEQYPSELLSGVKVYKTTDASLIGQGLAGTVDMQTARPLDFGGRVVSLIARGSRNSLGSAANSKATGNRFSATYIDQFADRSLGLVLGYSHQETPIQENQVALYAPWHANDAGTFNTDGIQVLRRTGAVKSDGKELWSTSLKDTKIRGRPSANLAGSNAPIEYRIGDQVVSIGPQGMWLVENGATMWGEGKIGGKAVDVSLETSLSTGMGRKLSLDAKTSTTDSESTKVDASIKH